MKHLFAPYDIALLAKNNNFNEPCLEFFTEINGQMYTSNGDGYDNIGILAVTSPFYNFDGYPLRDTKRLSAPLYQQLIDWFLTKHKILIRLESNGVQYEIIYLNPHYENGFLIGNNGAILNNITYNGLKNIDLALIEAFDLIKKIG